MGRLGLVLGTVVLFSFAPALIAQSNSDISKAYSDISKALLAQADMKVRADGFEEAQRLYEKALVANPASVEALLGLGLVHNKQGRIGRSLKYYRQALEIDPRSLPALHGQALAFLKRDLPDRAEQNAQRVAEICGTDCKQASDIRAALMDYRQKLADASAAEKGR